MKILLTGSNGLVGTDLKKQLLNKQHEILNLVRNRNQENKVSVFWDYERGILDTEKVNNIDCVIHLAGENISAKRWSVTQKQKILDSRIKSTQFLIESILNLKNKPGTFLSASAIGFYGDRGKQILTEKSIKGKGFLSDVCEAWEKATDPAKEAGIRVSNLRFGVILSEKGGALGKILLPFRMGAGGKIGSGLQYFSWITLIDTINAIEFCIQNQSISGPVNIVSPNPITNSELTKKISQYLHRPSFFKLPAFAAKLALGEMADEMLLASTRVKPEILKESGFHFEHKYFDEALANLV